MHPTELRIAGIAVLGLLAIELGLISNATAVDLFSEDFEGLSLGPIVTYSSEIRERNAWTPVPPVGWTVDNSAVATFGNPNSGVKEFEGWTFVDKDWWIATAGDQDRGQFANASGTIAVADPDEWDDFPGFSPSPDDLGFFDAKLTTPSISLAGTAANQAKVFFHSSWRDEDTQKATLTARYNTGASVELLRWDSRQTIDTGLGGTMPNPDFKDDAPNEGLTFDLMNPAGATSVQLEFRVFDAKNDWWWAFDNLQLFTGAAPSADGALRAIIDRNTGLVKIVNQTGVPVTLRGYSLRSLAGAFDEASAMFLSDNDSNWLQATQTGDPANDLSEIHLTSADLPNLGQINFGNVWRKFYRDSTDIKFEYLIDGSDEPVLGILEFTGNGGKQYDFLDLNYNGSVEIGDWLAFKAGFGTPLTDLPEVLRHNLGDLDNDKLHTALDFLEFEGRYNAANGAGSFALALAGVPEPGTASLLWLVGLIASCLPLRRRVSKRAISAVIALVALVGLAASDAHAQLKLFTEDFEGLMLGPNQEETTAGTNVWTNVPPTGWNIDNSGMPGIGDPMTDGVKEWAGWSFANREWWVLAAGDQDRGLFTRGQGTVMVADPDEWDDLDGMARENIAKMSTPNNLYDSFITTKTITIPAGIPAGRIKLAFDSSWRPEGMDDLDETNNQTATINVRYNGGPKIEVLRWDSDDDPENPFFHDDAPNERVTGIDLQYTGSATTLQLEFGMGKAWNDWWWAVDNISVEVPADPSVVKIDTVTGRGFLMGGDVISTTMKSIDIASAAGRLRGATTTGLSGASGIERIDGPDNGTTPGDSPGEQWEMLAATNNRVFEAFLFGDSTFDNSRIVDLGVIFDPATPAGLRDVTFSYTTGAGDVVDGTVQYFTATPVLGDYDNNGTVDAADYTLWRDHLGTNYPLPNQGATPGQVTSQDYDVWKAHFGESIGFGAGAAATAAVPEPVSAVLFGFALAVLSAGRNHLRRRSVFNVAALVLAYSQFAVSASAFTLDRDYRFGNDDPGAANNGNVGTTFDSAGAPGMHQLTDLAAVGGLGAPPKYVSITDRPDGVAGLGIRLNQLGVEKQYLKTGFEEALNFPERSPASIFSPGGTIDYSFVSDRGFQLWTQPTALPAANGRFDVVMDSNQHGVSIDSAGKFVMRYAYNDYVSSRSAVSNTWYHLSVVRPFGPNNGSILYVNGEAVAAAVGRYNVETILINDQGEVTNLDELDTSPLVVGANTGIGNSQPDPRPPTAAAGTANYFRGIVDDLEMFVMGLNGSSDFGEYVFESDNDYAAHFKPSNPVDLTGEGAISFADAQVFASNWLHENTLEWIDSMGDEQSLIVGDLISRSKGDFNFDGRVDLADWGMLNSASAGVGAMAMMLIQGGTVPEPATAASAMLAAVAVLCGPCRRTSRGTA